MLKALAALIFGMHVNSLFAQMTENVISTSSVNPLVDSRKQTPAVTQDINVFSWNVSGDDIYCMTQGIKRSLIGNLFGITGGLRGCHVATLLGLPRERSECRGYPMTGLFWGFKRLKAGSR